MLAEAHRLPLGGRGTKRGPMRIGLITDVHFGPTATHEGKLRKLAQYAAPLTEAFVAQMNAVEKPDLVINLGDVVEDESPAADRRSYREFLALVAPLEAPLVHVAGNHESVNLTDTDLAELWQHQGPLHYSRDVAGVHVTVLRTRHRREVDVHLPVEQIEWLRDDLAATPYPAIVVLHHPLSDMCLRGNRWFEKTPNICHVVEARAARKVLEESGKVVAVINGHVHWNHLDVIRGIPYITIQSLIENVDEDAPGRAAGTYALADLDEDRLLVRVLGEQPARYQFELGPGAA